MTENERQFTKESFRKISKKRPHGSLKSETTDSLVDELMEREGVRTIILPPYQDVAIRESGPAKILIVTD